MLKLRLLWCGADMVEMDGYELADEEADQTGLFIFCDLFPRNLQARG